MHGRTWAFDAGTLNEITGEITRTSPINMNIMANANSDNSTGRRASVEMQKFKIYEGGELVKYYLPAVNSSNVAGMYDVMDEAFYTNAGTGTFTTDNIQYLVPTKVVNLPKNHTA